jgi:hypothetical protein
MMPPAPPTPPTWATALIDHAGGFLIGVGNFITGFIAFLSWRSAHKASAQGERNATKIEEIHQQTNGMKDALVAATLAHGLKTGKEHEQQMQIARETQTAVLMEVLADPNATAADKASASALASRPITSVETPAETLGEAAHPIPVAIVASEPISTAADKTTAAADASKPV